MTKHPTGTMIASVPKAAPTLIPAVAPALRPLLGVTCVGPDVAVCVIVAADWSVCFEVVDVADEDVVVGKVGFASLVPARYSAEAALNVRSGSSQQAKLSRPEVGAGALG